MGPVLARVGACAGNVGPVCAVYWNNFDRARRINCGAKSILGNGWSREPLHFKKMAKPVKHYIGITSENFVSQRKLPFLDITPAKAKGTTRTLSKKRYSALGIFNAKSDTVIGTQIGTSTQIGTVNHISISGKVVLTALAPS